MKIAERRTQPRLSKADEHRHAETFYQAFKRSNDVMFYTDRDGIIRDVNDAFTKHYGWTRQEAVGKTPAILRSRHTTKDFYDRLWSTILDPKKGSWRGEIINKTKDGREVPLILSITAVRDVHGRITGYFSNAVDLSEQLALHARVAQSESLASIGEMAAVVAHEIRNPLGSIVMAAKQIVSGDLSAPDRETVLAVLRHESQRLNEALGNFLSYARPREVKLQPQDLNELVSEVVGIVKGNSELVRGAEVEVQLLKTLKPFPMDPDQVRQVLWNIVLNALQAMDGRGELSVETGHARGFAFFRVADTGPGIPVSAMTTIFKPFQTTKQQGTGLGLAIAERIVKAHGGRIAVKSEVGLGAAFTVYLPSIED
ncbi:MAG: PAS domain S-box protein [Elusimicrobia bacterium]|nr:PAS domain S-box protein [Elusimicrobiota bacterium]